MKKLEDWKQLIKDKDLRCTNQRLSILKVLYQTKYPLSAQEILTKLQEQSSNLRLSTVYRTLNSFEKKGIIRKLNFDSTEAKFELLDNNDHHHHLMCIECGEVVPLDCPLQKFEEDLSQKTGYHISDHKIKFYGTCPKCN